MVGPDNAIWFGLFNDVATSPNPVQDGDLGRLDASGTITTIDVPPVGSSPMLGTVTPDGRLWFGIGGNGNSQVNALANIAPDGTITSYPLRHRRRPDYVRFSALGPDGAIWYCLARANALARVTQAGAVTEFDLPPTSVNVAHPNDIAVGSDGGLWITEVFGNAIARVATDGTVTNTYMLSTEAAPWDIASGDDGNLWFTELGSQDFGDSFSPPQIMRMTTRGQATAFPLPPSSFPISIAKTDSGFVFTDPGTYSVGLIDYSGNIVELPIHGSFGPEAGGSGSQGAVQGVDGSYYFTDLDNDDVGKITLGTKGMIFPQAFTLPTGGSQLVGVGVLGDRGPYNATTDNSAVATVAPIQGFAMNFMVTAVGPGTTTLEIKGKGKPMTATVTVTAAAMTQSMRRSTHVRTIF